MRFPENLKVMFTLSRAIHLGSVDTDVIRNIFHMDLNRAKSLLRKVSESYQWLQLSADKRCISIDLSYIELRDDYLLKKSLSWFMASEIVFSSVASHHNVAQRLTEIMYRYVLACHKAGVVASPLELSRVFKTSPMHVRIVFQKVAADNGLTYHYGKLKKSKSISHTEAYTSNEISGAMIWIEAVDRLFVKEYCLDDFSISKVSNSEYQLLK